MLAGLALWPIDRALEVISGWRDIVDDAPHELSTACVILTAPPEEFVPDYLRGRTALGMGVMYVGDPEAGVDVVQPLKDLAPAIDLIGPMPYTAFQAIADPSMPHGMRSYWRGEYMNSLSDDAITTFTAHAPEVQAAGIPFSQMIVFRLGQAIQAVPDETAAFSHRDANYIFHPISMWADPADDEHVISVNRAFCETMRPFTTGAAYLNFTGEDRVREAFGDDKYARLVALKDRYDPDNLFRLNQNIRPSTHTGQPVPA